MTAKQYLRNMYYFQISIKKKEEKIKELQLLAESTGAIRYDKDRVITSLPQSAGYEDKVARIVEMQKKLLLDIAALTEMYEQGCIMINSLEDPYEKLVLEMRYINHMQFNEIAKQLDYSADAIYYKHRNALKKLSNCKV